MRPYGDSRCWGGRVVVRPHGTVRALCVPTGCAVLRLKGVLRYVPGLVAYSCYLGYHLAGRDAVLGDGAGSAGPAGCRCGVWSTEGSCREVRSDSLGGQNCAGGIGGLFGVGVLERPPGNVLYRRHALHGLPAEEDRHLHHRGAAQLGPRLLAGAASDGPAGGGAVVGVAASHRAGAAVRAVVGAGQPAAGAVGGGCSRCG